MITFTSEAHRQALEIEHGLENLVHILTVYNLYPTADDMKVADKCNALIRELAEQGLTRIGHKHTA